MLNARIQAAVQAALDKFSSDKKMRVQPDFSDTDSMYGEDDPDFDEEPYKFPAQFSMVEHLKATTEHDVVKANRDFWHYQIFFYYVTHKSNTQCNWLGLFQNEPFKTGFKLFWEDNKTGVASRLIIIGKYQDIVKLRVYQGMSTDAVMEHLTKAYNKKFN